MKITWLGTNTLLFETGEIRILFDPFPEFTGGENPSTVQDLLETGADCVFITHGHFDHLLFVPEMLDEGDVTVYCTKVPAQTLEKMTEETGRIVLIRPGMQLPVGDVTVRALQGKHIVFDSKLILRTVFSVRMLRFWQNLLFMAQTVRHFPEGKETLVYELCAEGKRFQILGSCGLDDKETYSPGADLLILPYQGSTRLVEKADEIIARLQPKRIMLSHFDDAFPPVSSSVDTRGLRQLMKKKYPKIPVVKPLAGKPLIF